MHHCVTTGFVFYFNFLIESNIVEIKIVYIIYFFINFYFFLQDIYNLFERTISKFDKEKYNMSIMTEEAIQ